MCVKATFPLLEAAAAVNNTSLSKVQVIRFFGVGVLSFFFFFLLSLDDFRLTGGTFSVTHSPAHWCRPAPLSCQSGLMLNR